MSQDLLQIALQRQDVEVVRTLLTFDAEPSRIVMDELFMEKFNRYPVRDTRGMWKLPPEMRQSGSKEGRRPSTPSLLGLANSPSSRSRLSFALSSAKILPVVPQPQNDSSFRYPRMFNRFKIERMKEWPHWGHAQQVLSTLVEGYGTHLKVRKGLAAAAGEPRIVPTFTDLMMWAVRRPAL